QVSRKFGRCATVVNIDPRRVRKQQGPERLAQSMAILKLPITALQELILRELQEPPVAQEDQSAALKEDKDEWWEVHINGGRVPTGLEAVAWARCVEALGAGEIVLTSMDADGTKAGYDLPMTGAVSRAVRIPVVASGGAGSPEHLRQAFEVGA